MPLSLGPAPVLLASSLVQCISRDTGPVSSLPRRRWAGPSQLRDGEWRGEQTLQLRPPDRKSGLDALPRLFQSPLFLPAAVCIAMMILVREELLAGDFTHNIKLLQRYPRTTDIAEVIQDAILLRI